jgi:hypothetical protein
MLNIIVFFQKYGSILTVTFLICLTSSAPCTGLRGQRGNVDPFGRLASVPIFRSEFYITLLNN